MLPAAGTYLNFVFLAPSSSWYRRHPTYKLTTSGVSLGGRSGKTPDSWRTRYGWSTKIHWRAWRTSSSKSMYSAQCDYQNRTASQHGPLLSPRKSGFLYNTMCSSHYLKQRSIHLLLAQDPASPTEFLRKANCPSSSTKRKLWSGGYNQELGLLLNLHKRSEATTTSTNRQRQQDNDYSDYLSRQEN
jgi:hypothetical protein